jgi:hypothetical protein
VIGVHQIALIKNLVAGLNYDASLNILNFAAVINAVPSLLFIGRCEDISKTSLAQLLLKCISYDHRQAKMDESNFY